MAKKFSAVIKRRNRYIRGGVLKKNFRGFLFSRYAFLFLLALVVAGGLAYYFFISDKFLIRQIKISGASSSIEASVDGYVADILESKLLFFIKKNKTTLFPEAEISKNITSVIPKIKEADIRVMYPGIVEIGVVERTQHGIWCEYNISTPVCYFYDDDGIIYQTAPNSVRGSLIVSLRDKREVSFELGDKAMEADIIEFTDELSEALRFAYEKPFYISIESDTEIRAGFGSGWEAYFSTGNPVLESVENLILVIEEEINTRVSELEYIDLRLGNKVFYKYKAQDILD